MSSRAHPRSRGENVVGLGRVGECPGSSPLTRGKPTEEDPHPYVLGLIPAHAGKTCRGQKTQSQRWAHPRSRGENEMVNMRGVPFGGSSPLTRGKPERKTKNECARGLIPAHAGKTLDCEGVGLVSGAHPRSRGENARAGARGHACEGSSPLTRGKRFGEDHVAGVEGSSPLTRGKPSLPVGVE